MAAAAGEGHHLTATRVIAAPLERVWQSWSDEQLIQDWWGPHGFTGAVHRMDFREGGTTLVSMSAPDFGQIYTIWTYTRIVPQQQIDFESRFADSEGRAIDPIAPGVPDVVPHVVTLKDLGDGQTELSITESGYSSLEAMQMSKAGQEQVLDKLTLTAVKGGVASRGRRDSA